MRIALALVLLTAAAAKGSHVAEFRKALARYEILPRASLGAVAPAAIAAETLLGVWLLTDIAAATALAAAAVMFAVFGVVAATSRYRDKRIDCGCLGGVIRLRLDWHVAVADVIAALAAALAATHAAASGTELAGYGRSASIMVGMSGILLAVTFWLVMYGLSVRRTRCRGHGAGVANERA